MVALMPVVLVEGGLNVNTVPLVVLGNTAMTGLLIIKMRSVQKIVVLLMSHLAMKQITTTHPLSLMIQPKHVVPGSTRVVQLLA